MTVAYIVVAALVVVAIYFGVRYFVRATGEFRGSRVIICPETGQQAMVEVDTRRAALTSLVGQTEIRLEELLALALERRLWPGVLAAD